MLKSKGIKKRKKNYIKVKSDKKNVCFNKDFIGGLLNKEKNKKIV